MNKKPFGELLREIRNARGTTIRSLADRAGMDPGYLSRIENGKTGPTKQDTVEKLAEALCKEQHLDKNDCERLTRHLLVSTNYMQTRDELIDDLWDRFSARLHDEGFPEDKIDEALARVPLATMHKVLLGEEKLEIGYQAEFSSEDIKAREDKGEEVLMFDLLPTPLASKIENHLTNVRESATGYLDRHAKEFTTHRKQKRALPSQDKHRSIRAGHNAEIRLRRPINKDQEQQLRLIAKLINSILKENKI